MNNRAETYTYHQLFSVRHNKMKIESLLNAPVDGGPAEYGTTGSSHSQQATMSASSHSGGYAQSYSPSLVRYWDGQYQGHHGPNPGAACTASTRVSSGSSSSNCRHQPHRRQSQGQSQHLGSGRRHPHRMVLPYQPTNASAHSSRDPYHRREQYSSVSSSSSNNGQPGRPPRPKYEEEEIYFIWYHRVDLCQEWKEVRESFNRQFPGRQRRGFQGLQCKFYRFIKEKKCPTLREQRRMRKNELCEGASVRVESGAPQFGVREWTNVWFPWMCKNREMGQ